MKPELKLGRRVIAWNSAPYEYKGTFISNSSKGVWVLMDGANTPASFDHVKPDLTAEPMNGDEVEGSKYKDRCFDRFRYIGQRSGGLHCVEANGIQVVREHVRFPQQSKWDRVKEAIRSWQESSKVPMYDDLADQIDKIYKEE